MLCKTIILSNSQNLNNNPKGILTLSNENNYIKGKIRLYNIDYLPKSTKVGLYIDEKVYTSAIDKKPGHYEFSLTEKIDITKSVYCALIDISNNKQVILEGGSFTGFYFTDSPFDAILEAKDPELESQITETLANSSNCNTCNCENCEYKRYFYDNHFPKQTEHLDSSPSPDENHNLILDESNSKTDFQENIIPLLENELLEELKTSTLTSNNPNNDIDFTTNIKNNDIGNTANPSINNDTDISQREKLEFLNDIVYQLDEMFLRYPAEESISEIIPNSKFVLVDADAPYVLGAIYENDIIKYIAYGVPAQYNSLPPSDLGNHYQWLPLNPRDAMSDGYFMIYQNAVTGSIVEITFE